MATLKRQKVNKLPTISTLINAFFLYLHNLSSNVNCLIEDIDNNDEGLKDIFLLKYSIFGLTFANKLTSDHDKKFANLVDESFTNNLKEYTELLKQNNSKASIQFGKMIIESSNIYSSILEEFYRTEINRNDRLSLKSTHFHILPFDDPLDVKNPRKLEELSSKLTFLSGCIRVNVSLSPEFYPEIGTLGSNSRKKNLIYVNGIGLPINNTLLKTIIGHPKVIRNVLSHFIVS